MNPSPALPVPAITKTAPKPPTLSFFALALTRQKPIMHAPWIPCMGELRCNTTAYIQMLLA